MTTIANGRRGEVTAMLGGETRRLCLTLGALAEIETGLGLAHWSELPGRLARPSARELAVVLAAMLRGGGEVEAARRVEAEAIDPVEAIAAVASAFAASVGD